LINENEEWKKHETFETQLLIASKVGYIDGEKYNELHNGIIEIEKQLSGLILLFVL